jgi:hypothetical protein
MKNAWQHNQIETNHQNLWAAPEATPAAKRTADGAARLLENENGNENTTHSRTVDLR